MGSRNLIDAAPTLRRGGSDSTVTRTCRATGEALLVPARNRRSRVGRITGETGKSAEDERVAAGSAVAMKRSNVRGAKGPCHLWRGLETWRGRNASAATRAPVPDPTDAAGAGNVAWSRWCDTRRRKSEPTGNTNFDLNRRASPRPYRQVGPDQPPWRSINPPTLSAISRASRALTSSGTSRPDRRQVTPERCRWTP